MTCCCHDCHHEAFIQRAAEADGVGDVFDVLGYPAVSFQVYGVLAGGSDVNFEFLSGTDWYALPVVNASTGVASATGIVSAEGTYIANTVGLQKVRARISGYGGADSVNVVATAVCEGDGTTVGGPSGGGGPTNDVNVNEWGGTATTLGQKVMDESVPVTIASDQSIIPADIVGAGTYSDISAVDAKNANGAAGNTEVLGVALLAYNQDATQFPRLRAGLGAGTGVVTAATAEKVLNDLPLAQYNATPPTLVDTNFETLQLDNRGNLKTAAGSSTAANTPSIVTAAASDALAANAARKLWSIQNLGTNPLFVRLGTGASTTVFHFILKPGTVADDGNGGFMSDEVWKGIVSYDGTSPRLVVTELT